MGVSTDGHRYKGGRHLAEKKAAKILRRFITNQVPKIGCGVGAASGLPGTAGTAPRPAPLCAILFFILAAAAKFH